MNKWINIEDITLESNQIWERSIKGKVLTLSDLGTVNPGKPTFHFTLGNKKAKIDIAVFDDAAIQLHPQMKLNQNVAVVNNFTVDEADKKYNYTGHKYCLRYNRGSSLEFLEEDIEVEPLYYGLKSIKHLKRADNIDQLEPVHILGVVLQCMPLQDRKYLSESDRMEKFRRIWISDESGIRIRVALWSNVAENFNYENQHPIVLLFGVRLDTYVKRSDPEVIYDVLEVERNSMIKVLDPANPHKDLPLSIHRDITPQVTRLKKWVDIYGMKNTKEF